VTDTRQRHALRVAYACTACAVLAMFVAVGVQTYLRSAEPPKKVEHQKDWIEESMDTCQNTVLGSRYTVAGMTVLLRGEEC
jgi:hypothetical protein